LSAWPALRAAGKTPVRLAASMWRTNCCEFVSTPPWSRITQPACRPDRRRERPEEQEPLLIASRPPAPNETQAEAAALDVIFIEGFTGETVIGIHDSELHRPQPVVIDVHAGVPRALACSTDRIGDTIDYGAVHERLRELLREHRLQLLEAFAQAIAELLIEDFGAAWVRVKVVKPKKFDDVAAVGVVIEREAGEHHAIRQARSAAVLQLIGSGLGPQKT
jgi:7,8-dihydroneopterin aldolase/epimerase/oxygenase